MTYGWLLVILVIAGAALYAMGILNPSTYQKKGCVGFQHIHYKDHLFRATGSVGLWTVWSSETERESVFQLRVQNGAGETLRIRGIDAEYPEGVHVTWSERGYDCDTYNTAGDTDSGCQEQNVSEGELATFSMEDVGRGMQDLHAGKVYRMKVKVTFDVFNAIADHSESAICSGKVEGGSGSSSSSTTPPSNLLVNGDAETGSNSGWTIINSCGNTGWQVKGASHSGTYGFITSYKPSSGSDPTYPTGYCRRSQEIDLLAAGYTAGQLDAAPTVHVEEWFAGTGPDKQDWGYVKVELRDASHNVIASWATGAFRTSTSWEKKETDFTGYGTGLRHIYFEDGSCDNEWWQNWYGAAHDDAVVSIS